MRPLYFTFLKTRSKGSPYRAKRHTQNQSPHMTINDSLDDQSFCPVDKFPNQGLVDRRDINFHYIYHHRFWCAGIARCCLGAFASPRPQSHLKLAAVKLDESAIRKEELLAEGRCLKQLGASLILRPQKCGLDLQVCQGRVVGP